MLSDATGFTGYNIGFSDCIKQSGFTVIYMAHYGDYGRAGLEVFFFVVSI